MRREAVHIGFGWMCSSLDFLVSGQVLVPPKHWGLLLGLTPRGKKKHQNHPVGAVSGLFFILPAAISFFRS